MLSPQKVLRKLGRGPIKGLGQHFLIHLATAEKIAAAIQPKPGDVVVEIGAGLGALTAQLSMSGAYLIAVEIDPELTEFLREELLQGEREERISIECLDVLKLDFVALSKRFHKKLKIIGNLPYNISSPVLFKLLEASDCIQEAVLMLQTEVAERVLAGPGSRDHGILSVMSAYHCECRRFMKVKPSQFHPPPRVDSQVISLGFRPCPLKPQVEAIWLLAVVKAAFSHRRKTLRNSMLASNLPNLRPVLLDEAFEEANIESRRRPESLGLQDFLNLASALQGASSVQSRKD